MDQKKNNEISDLLKQFNEDDNAKRLVEKYCSPLIYDNAFGVCHSESLHTNFLIWLLKHGSKNPSFLQALKKFLKLVCERGCTQEYVSKDVKDIRTLLSNSDTRLSLKEKDIKNEVITSYIFKTKNQKNSRVDIVIDIDIYKGNKGWPVKIIIENKIYSREHNDQTKIYYGYFSEDNDYIKDNLEDIYFYQKKRNGRKKRVYNKQNEELQLFVFLHPQDYDLDYLAPNKCKYFIPISYQDLLDNLLLKKSINEFSETEKFYIEEYKKILIKPSTLTYRIMAKDTNDKDILKHFAEKYMPLFKLAIRELGTSIAEEQIVDGIDQLSAQRYKYSLMINEDKIWDSLKMHEVAHYVVEYLGLEKKLSLNELRALFANDYWVLKEDEYNRRRLETNQTKKRFERRWDKIGKLELFVSKEWTKDRFNDFANKLEKKYSIIIEESI